MKVHNLGEGDPEIAVVGSIHGDEPCGRKAIERFVEGDFELLKPVKLVIANEEALERGERFIDCDLNRSFPGDPESDNHEERLAAEILEEVRGTKLLDIHSTHSEPVPYAAFGSLTDGTVDVISAAGVENACHFTEDAGSLNEKLDGSVVEAGPQGTEEAADMAYRVLVNFLSEMGVIDADSERSEPRIFEFFETVEGGDWEFLGRNFSEVKEGEVFARSGTTELVTTEPFYPVLMSTDGYEDILGHKARKLSDEEMEQVEE